MHNILVTGATGFLGKYIVNEALKQNNQVVALGNSELRSKLFNTTFRQVPLYLFDIAQDYGQIKKIIKKHNIEYIIHSAALKHVDLCENNVMRVIDVNINGAKNIINAANECDIKNLIGISTDKSINPSCVYGTTKNLVESMLKNQQFGVFQGVNFLYSSGSVLEIWEKQMKEGKQITVNSHANRYFALVQDIAKNIIKNLDRKDIFSIDVCYKISISDLQKAFSQFYNYYYIQEYDLLNVEKLEEEPPNNIKILKPTIEEIVELIKFHKSCEI